jgi:hypothetical protein
MLSSLFAQGYANLQNRSVLNPIYLWVVEAGWNEMAHAQKPDFIFRRNRRVHFNPRGRQFSRLLAAEVCASAFIVGSNAGYTMFRGSEKGTGYLLHSSVSTSLPLPCFTLCHHISTGVYILSVKTAYMKTSPLNSTVGEVAIVQAGEEQYFSKFILTFYSRVITMCTTCSNITSLCNFPTWRTLVFRRIIIINSNKLTKQQTNHASKKQSVGRLTTHMWYFGFSATLYSEQKRQNEVQLERLIQSFWSLSLKNLFQIYFPWLWHTSTETCRRYFIFID